MDSETFAIKAAQSGSEQAWRELFERHFDPVYHFCVALAGGRQDLAEEVAHEVFVVAACRIHRFNPARATFRAWLLGIARNRRMAIQARENRCKRHEQLSAEKGSDAECRSLDLRVHEALARLPSRYRIALEAKYLRGLTMKETDDHALLGQHLAGDPPREAFKSQTLSDSTAVFIRVRQFRSARRKVAIAAVAVLIAGIAFLGGRLSAPTATLENVRDKPLYIVESGSTVVPNELLAWLDAASLFRQLGMRDRMARAVERAARLLPVGTFVDNGRTSRAFAAASVENQKEHPQPMGTPGPNPPGETMNRILAQSFGD